MLRRAMRMIIGGAPNQLIWVRAVKRDASEFQSGSGLGPALDG